MNYFKEAERVLNNYENLKKSLRNIQRRKERIIKSGAPQDLKGSDTSKPYNGSGFVNDTYGQFLDLLEVQNEEQETAAKISEIENVVNQLTPENSKMIALWYFERKTKEQIAELLDVFSNTTVYNYRNNAVSEFAILYFGAGALTSI